MREGEPDACNHQWPARFLRRVESCGDISAALASFGLA
jgi:hypothetical protein